MDDLKGQPTRFIISGMVEKKSFTFFLALSALILIVGFLIASGSFNAKSPESENSVVGIQTSVCCSCPKRVAKSQIEKEGWVLYENNKDYTNLLPKSCRAVQCNPCEPNGLYICPTNGWVNCMPVLTEKAKKGCTPEAIKWYKANCPNFQGIAQ